MIPEIFLDVRDISLLYRIDERASLGRLWKRSTATRPTEHNNFIALKGINFTLTNGDRLGLLGTNGAGKTTLLKVIYGILKPDSGDVIKHGSVDALFNIRLGFKPDATGRRNIELRGLVMGWTPTQIAQSIDEIIEFSELNDFIDRPLKTYSQGMAARLAFSIATARRPEILLLDEWIGAGDKNFQAKASKRLHDMADSAGIVILASHNENLIRSVCNKTLTLENGMMKSEIVDI
jgi:ABC-type polysaccharide/polyol phosphate transport system ATPase subunit